MSCLSFNLHSVGVLAPGFGSLADVREASRCGLPLDAAAPPALPSPSMLPANERRRASKAARWALGCIEQALQGSPFPAGSLRSVFATDEGTGEVCQQMLETLAATRHVSPLLFPNSVHNAPSGYFAIAWENRQAATVVSLGLESFASGLLCAVAEAVALHQPVLLVAYDPPMTAPLSEVFPVVEPTATAWIISAGEEAARAPVLASFELELSLPGQRQPTSWPSWLPARWAAHSSAYALAVLGLLEAPQEAVHSLPLAGQLLSLRRIDGVHP